MNKKLILIILAMVLVISSTFVLVSCGEEVNIDHVEIYSMPKTQYSLGEALDVSNAKLLVVYKNNTEELVDVTSSMLSGYNANVLGEQYIRVYYQNHSTIFTVTVTRAPLSHIELVTEDANLNYVEGQPLRTEGNYMLINFSDGSSERINVTKDMCSGYDPYRIGNQIINVVGYLDGIEYSSSFAVTVTARELIGIEVTTAPTKQIYYVGDSALDLTGGELFLKYNSGYSTYVDMTDVDGNAIEGLEVSWDSSVVNNRTPVTVTYGYQTTTFQVQVKIRDVSAYEILTPAKEQMQNLALDLTGTQIRINYNNGESEEVTLPNDKVSVIGYDNTKAGTQQVVLSFSYGGVTLATQGIMEINVAEREAIGLEMVNAPTIYQDTEFDVSEFSVCVVYNNGEKGEAFNINSAMIAWENNVPLTSYATAGEKNWYITYRTGVDLDYKFNVQALRVTEIELLNANNVVAFLGGKADTSDVRMTVTYNSGLVVEDVALDPDMVSFDNTTMGLKLAKINYVDKYESGFETDLYLTVVKEIASIIVGGNYRNVYVIGEEFSPSGMELEVSYVGEGSTVIIKESEVGFYDSWSFRTDDVANGLLFNKVGEAKVYVVNAGLKEDYPITVTVKNEFKELGPIYKADGEGYTEVADLGTVVQGMPIDLTGYYILATFEGGQEHVQLTQAMLNYNAKNTTVGERQVTVYYPDFASYAGDVGRTYPTVVNVIEKSVVGIKMLSAPDRKIYYRNADNPTAPTEYKGIALSLEYDNGTYSAINVEDAIAKSRLIFRQVDVSEIGICEVEYTYSHTNNVDYTGFFEVEVVDSTPVSISWTLKTIPEVELTIGTKFNPIGLGYRENGMPYSLSDRNVDILSAGSTLPVPKKLIDIIDFITIEGYNANQTGVQDVRLVYGGNPDLYVTVKVNVRERRLESLVLLNDGETLKVIQGAPIDLSLLSLKLLFNDGAESQVPMDAKYINRSEFNPQGYDVNDATVGKRNVTISYLYGNEAVPVTLTVSFDVAEKSLVKIEINDIPKQYYVELESFDQTEGSIMLYYDNGTTAIEYLSTAAINSQTALFNVDNSRFDNSEFSGFSKVQRIYVRYSDCTTSFNIYMRDRRDVVAEYASSNVYTFTYGSAVAPSVELKGYENYGDNDREFTFNSANYVVEYIPQEIWLNQGRVEGKSYETFPTLVGKYVVVVSYEGDAIHNAYEDASELITINKKAIYVDVKDKSKIYGTQNPTVEIILSSDGKTASNDPKSLFQYDDSFNTPEFNPNYDVTYSTLVNLVDGQGNLVTEGINAFKIVYLYNDEILEVGEGSAKGRYTVSIENQFVSPNYDVHFDTAVLNILARKVKVTPQSISYVYGAEVVPVIPYETSVIEGESDSGLYGTDKLEGSLSRENVATKDVGEYAVTIGSLQLYSPNYEITFVEDVALVTITARKIYVKTDSIIKVYGEEFVAPEVKFFSDPACTMEANAFASGDSLGTIGTIVFGDDIKKDTKVGTYTLPCTIDKKGMGKDNYEVIYVNGYVEISKRPVSVVALATSKVFGQVDPLIGYSVLGIEGDSASGLIELSDGTIEELSGALTRVAGENYGEYTILIGSLHNDNYDVRFTSNKFSILRKALYARIEAQELTKAYDGRLPSVSSYQLLEGKEEGAQTYEGADLSSLISFSFEGASKNFGAYRVGIAINSNNYTLELCEEYFYNIERRVVSITANEFTGIPYDLEYKGEAYNFYAEISMEDIQKQYNQDGSVATDDNNNPLYDDRGVTLSIASATNAGSYTVSVVELSDKNYELNVEESKAITFEIKPRTVYVVLKTNASNHTIEREFNNQSAYISAADYTLENLISERDIPYFTFGIYAGNNVVTATDVLYGANGEIIGYDVRIAENSIDANYVVELKEAYKYKIVPKDVVIRIYEKYLSKPFDGTAPQISPSMFAPVSAVTGFDSNSVSFEFLRDGNDGRDNTSVGTYSIIVTCSDGNFNVTTQQPNYVYQITSGNVSVSIDAQALEKAYDGQEYAFEYDDLIFTAYYGNTMLIRNFRYGDAYDNFVAQLQGVEKRIDDLDTQMGLVDFADTSFAKNNVNSSINNAYSLRVLLQSIENPMNAENTGIALSAVETIISRLAEVVTALNNGDKETAEEIFNLCLNHLASIKNVLDKEQSYIAFIFGTEDDNTAIEVGNHPFEVKFSDYNRNFTLLNTNLYVSISKHTLYVNVQDIVLTYGQSLDSIPYELYDPRTGETLDKNLYHISGNPTTNVAVKNVGLYEVDVSSMYISEDGYAQSENYVLLGGSVGSIEVVKATLTVRIKDVSDPNVFVYGKTVESSQITAGYEYLDAHSILENTTNERERKVIEDAYAWANENGYGHLDYSSKMSLYIGGIQYGEDLSSILKTGAVKYNCYINGESGAQIFDTTLFDAGDYNLGATGFKADNYNVRVVSGVLTVAKRELSVYTHNGYYEKEYGESYVEYVYTGFIGQDNANNVDVHVNDNGKLGEIYSNLLDMTWEHSVGEDEIDPLDPMAEVTDEALPVSLNTNGYLLKNYTINFGTLNVKVTQARLTCSLVPVSGNIISSLYMALPTADTYAFIYEGFKNEDNESIIEKQPTINFKNGSAFYDAGVHTLGQMHLNVNDITLKNYYLEVNDFQYEVRARKIYVSLEDVDAVMSEETGSFSLRPYIAQISYNVEQSVVTGASIIAGQYGYDNFKFTIEGDDVTDAIRNEFNSVVISKFASTDSGAVFDKNEDGSSYKEIYRYTDMYKHSINTIKVDHDNSKAIVALSNMSMNSRNFRFEYDQFEVTVHSTIAMVYAESTEKIVVKEGEGVPSIDSVNAGINIHVVTSALRDTTLSVKEMLSNGTLTVNGALPSKAGANALIEYVLNDNSYRYVLSEKLTGAYYTNYYSGVQGATSVSVSDDRVREYDYSGVASCILPIRYYSQISSVVNNPTLDGAEYGVRGEANGVTTIKSQETLYNAMRLEIAVEPNASVKAPSFEIGFNGTDSTKYVSLLFKYGVGNSVIVALNKGADTASASFSVAYGNLFDGKIHDVRVYLDKESLYLIVYVDGFSSELIDLNSILKENEELLGLNVSDIAESTSLTLKVAGDYLIRSLTLSEQGLYDGTGAHIRLPVNAERVLRVNTLLDVFTATQNDIAKLFGIVNVGEAYSAVYYVNGAQIELSEMEVYKFTNGVHFVEVALYKDGALVDYDSTYVIVERDGGAYWGQENGWDEVAGGATVNFYTVSNMYNDNQDVDKTLVGSSAQSQYSYLMGSTRDVNFGSLNYYNQYFNMSFELIPSAIYMGSSASYRPDDYTTTIELFANSGKTVEEAYGENDQTYQGIALKFTRTQTEDVQFNASTINEAYTYKAELISYVNGVYNVVTIASGTRNSAYELTLYKDRNCSYFGNNNVVVAIRSLYSDEVMRYDFVNEDVDASGANIRITMYGYGDRMVIYNAKFEEGVVATRDYLLDGTYKLNNGAVSLEAGKTLTHADKAGNALYSNFNDVSLSFTINGEVAGQVVRINLADSKEDGSGNGAYLLYDLEHNTLSFQFYYQGIMHSLAQVYELSGAVNGAHSLNVKFNKSLVASSLANYVGGDKEANLTYNGVELTDTKGVNKVHYSMVEVAMDGESTTFYMPLFNDMGLWKRDNGSTYGNSNNYSTVESLGAPTFLALHNYSSVVAPAGLGIQIDGYATTNGEYNGFLPTTVAGTPII